MKGRSRRVFALAMLVATAPALVACSSRGDPDDEPRPSLARDDLPGLVGRRCEYTSRHDQLPGFSDLARVGTRGNIALWGAEMSPGDTAIVSVRYGEDGRLVWVRTIDTSLAADRVAPLEKLLMQSLSERGPADWGVRLRIEDGDLAGLAPSVLCPPEPGEGGPRDVVPLPISRQDIMALNNAQGRHYPVRIALDERGRVMGVRLERPSGQQVVDQFLVDWVLATDFHPKLHDGIGIASTLTETLYLPRRRR